MVDDLEDTKMEEALMEEQMTEVNSIVELSLNSMVGLTTPGMFKVKGLLEHCKIITTMDCRATHNFISLTCRNPQHFDGRNNQLWGYHGVWKSSAGKGNA